MADNGDTDGDDFVPEVDEDEENENGSGATKSDTRDSKRPASRGPEKPAPVGQTGMSNAAQSSISISILVNPIRRLL